MPRPPKQIFQKAISFAKKTTSKVQQEIKMTLNKWFLFAFLLIELSSFIVEYLNSKAYYEMYFNLFANSLFVVLFIFILNKVKFCLRNKLIVYSLIAYYLLNAILPFFITNLQYESIMKNTGFTLFSILIFLTLWKNTGTK